MDKDTTCFQPVLRLLRIECVKTSELSGKFLLEMNTLLFKLLLEDFSVILFLFYLLTGITNIQVYFKII